MSPSVAGRRHPFVAAAMLAARRSPPLRGRVVAALDALLPAEVPALAVVGRCPRPAGPVVEWRCPPSRASAQPTRV